MTPELQGQIAIVTGGGRGVGRAIAEGLSGAGAAVAIAARSHAELAETAAEIARRGGHAMTAVLDVRDRGAVDDMVEAVERELGPVTLLVNNAGTGAAIGPTWEVDPEAWWTDVEVVLRGAMLCSRAVLPRMIARGRGRIANVSSRAGAFGSPFQSAYSCSRAALFQFSEALAREVKAHGVQVFSFTPGVMRTAMTEHMLNSDAGKRWLPALQAMTAGGKTWVDPKSVAAAMVALASGRLDALSGRWIHSQDDLDALAARAADIEAQDTRALRLRD